MSIMDCMRGQVPKKVFDEVNEQYETLLKNNNGDAQIADAALVEWLPSYRADLARNRVDHALSAMKVEQRVVKMEEQMAQQWSGFSDRAKKTARILSFGNSPLEPTRANAVARLYNLADLEAQQGARELIGQLSSLYEEAAPKWFAMDADRKLMGEVTRGLIDGVDTIADAEARKIAKELRGILDKSIESYRQAGGLIGKIENYVPVRHNSRAIIDAGFDAWYAAYREMTDISKVVDYTTGKMVDEEGFERIARIMFEDIKTNGQSRTAREVERTGKSKKFGNPDMFSRRMQARLTTPKNGEAFAAYNKAFGVGDEGMFDLILANLENIGRDTGIMRALGPTPYNINQQLMKTVELDENEVNPRRGSRTVDALFRTMVGHWDGSVDDMLSRGATNIHNMMSSNLLGTASIAALGDKVFSDQTARLYGLVGGKDMKVYFETMVKGADMDEMLRQHSIFEALSHTNVSRFDGTIGITPAGRMMTGLNNLKNMNHRISGLQRITIATGNNTSMAFFGDISNYIAKGKAWDSPDIPKELRSLMESMEFDGADWDRLLKHGVGDKGLLTPNILPDEMSSIAGKLDRINMQMRLFATNAPDLRQRMYSTGNWMGERMRGDRGHLLSSMAFQFKSFPMMVWKNHFVPSAIQFAEKNYTPMGMLLLESFFYGAMIVQLKEVIAGREPMEWDSKELYAKAFLQSGAAGLFGDFLFKDPNGYGRNFVQDLAGPGIGATATFAQRSLGALFGSAMYDDYNVNWGSINNAAKPFVPLATLWYTKTAMDRILFDGLTAAMEGESFYDNANAKNTEMQKERGGTGWWPKGQFTPAGL